MPLCSLGVPRRHATSERIIGVRFRKGAVGGDRDELVLAVPREVPRVRAARDMRHAPRVVILVRAARPCGEPVVLPEGVGDGLAALGARHPVARRVVGVATVGGEAVHAVVGVVAVEGRPAEVVRSRDDAPERVVPVREAAETSARRRSPDDVRHAVHYIIFVRRRDAVRVRDRRDQAVPRAVAEAHRSAPHISLPSPRPRRTRSRRHPTR